MSSTGKCDGLLLRPEERALHIRHGTAGGGGPIAPLHQRSYHLIENDQHASREG
jgi:hypothetical protein